MSDVIEDQTVKRALLDLIFPPEYGSRGDPVLAATRRTRMARRKKYDPELDAPSAHSKPGNAVQVLETLTTRTIAVRWSSSQSGYYGEQVWRIGCARRVAQCALSGRLIQPGDAVFKPSAVGRTPFNCDRMILASAVWDAPYGSTIGPANDASSRSANERLKHGK